MQYFTSENHIELNHALNLCAAQFVYLSSRLLLLSLFLLLLLLSLLLPTKTVLAVETKQNKQRLMKLLERLLTCFRDNQHDFQHMGGHLQWARYYEDFVRMLDKASNISIPTVSWLHFVKCKLIK